MMQKRIDESFWDGLGVEIEACADFPPKVGFREMFPGPGKKSRNRENFSVPRFFPGTGKISRIPSFLLKFAHGPISTP